MAILPHHVHPRGLWHNPRLLNSPSHLAIAKRWPTEATRLYSILHSSPIRRALKKTFYRTGGSEI
ncbi:hypothetical protein M0804_013041 [Polistes exclamans]|nr:hypothetical protein M0804_013041 [Polistes exclamans]